MKLFDLLDSTQPALTDPELRIHGVVVLPVMGVDDRLGTGTVRVRIPWGGGIELQAPVASPMAGGRRGLYAMPRKGDNVLVAFEAGLPSRPFVIGALWGTQDQAPLTSMSDPEGETVLRTGGGQEVRIDERKDTITLSTSKGLRVVCTQDKVALQTDANGSCQVVVHSDGRMELVATKSLTIQAPSIEVKADQALKLSGTTVSINGNSMCEMNAPTVKLN